MKNFLSVVLMLCLLGGVTLNAEEKKLKIISLCAYHTEILTALGAEDMIIAEAEDYIVYDTRQKPFTEFSAFSFLKNKDLSPIIKAKPDWIFVTVYDDIANKEMIDELKQSGIKIYSRHVLNPNDLYVYWREVGKIVGKNEEAEKLILDFEARLKPYYDASSKRENPPRIFVEAIYSEIKTFNPDSITMWVIRMAGGRNVADDAKCSAKNNFVASYGPEKLKVKANEVDIFISNDLYDVDYDILKNRKSYRDLKAFKNNKVYKSNNLNIWRPTPSLMDAIEEIAVWTELELEEEINNVKP